MTKKKGVVWVSTVLYILISLAIIGIVIAALTPRINSAKDKATIEQTMIMLNSLDSTITQVNQVQGTKLENNFKMARGLLTIDASNNKILWQLDNSAYKYSEPKVPVAVGNILAYTEQSQAGWKVTLTMKYENMDIRFNNSDTEHILQPAETPYKLWIENKGAVSGKNQIDLSVS